MTSFEPSPSTISALDASDGLYSGHIWHPGEYKVTEGSLLCYEILNLTI